jgi:cell wall-associated NlpC family hydrolase
LLHDLWRIGFVFVTLGTRRMKKFAIVFYFPFLMACNWSIPESNEGLIEVGPDTIVGERVQLGTLTVNDTVIPVARNTANTISPVSDTTLLPSSIRVDAKAVQPDELMNFAETLIGVPYVYASTNPKVGFDCSGFITYVFNHFKVSVPRSSVDFTNVGKEVPVKEARRGDIILFTGTNPAERHVGHMGLVVSNTDTLRFIHATSGKAMGVTVSPLATYYQSRFVKAIRVF